MGDGWETRRSRGKNFDWLILKCATAGKINNIQIDTHHFKGNYPDKCSLQAAYLNGKISAKSIVNKSKNWKLLLSKVKLHAHKKHNFKNKLMKNKTPMFFVQWSSQKPNSYKLIVSIENKKGSLADFLQYLAKIDVNLVTISLSEHENTHAHFFEMVVDVPEKNRDKLLNKDNDNYKIIEFIPLADAYKKI